MEKYNNCLIIKSSQTIVFILEIKIKCQGNSNCHRL